MAGAAGSGGAAGTSGSGGSAGADPCAGVTCDSPPADSCESSGTLKTHEPIGTCSGGACSYTEVLVPCTHGCASSACSCSETPEPIEPNTLIGGSDMAMDSEGTLHVIYWRPTGGLEYASRAAGGSWSLGDVDASTGVGWFPSITIDANDDVHVSYGIVTVGGLKYAHKAKAASTFNASDADATAAYGHNSSIGVDGSGAIYIAHYHDGADDLLLTTRPSGGAFGTNPVDTMDDVGRNSSLVAETDGTLHIVYSDNTSEALKYAHRPPGGSFTITDIDPTRRAGSNSLVVDAAGGVHVSYYDNTSFLGTLRYAFMPPGGGAWQLEPADTVTRVGFSNSLGVDSAGGVHVAHYHVTAQDLRYSTKPPGGVWSSRTLAMDGIVGEEPSLVVDRAGIVHIIYGDRDGGNVVRYRRVCP